MPVFRKARDLFTGWLAGYPCWAVIPAFLVLFLWGCAPEEPVLEPEPVDIPPLFAPVDGREVVGIVQKDLQEQGLDSWEDLAPALEKSLDYVRTRDGDQKAVCQPELCLTWSDIKETLELFIQLLPDIDRNPELLKHYFDFYAVNPDVLLTGYYEPELKASREKHDDFRHPVYGRPDNLKSVDLGQFHPRWKDQRLYYRLENGEIKPYYSRGEIELEDALAGRDLEIAWVKDPIDLFFLHIQGSGRLKYPGGDYKHVLYADRNGHQYVALGRVLVDLGFLEQDEVSMQSIRAVLQENPDIKHELMAKNPSYIFFHLDDQGPRGSTGQILTPWVSVASDPEVIPWGSVMIMDAELPEYQGQKTHIQGPVTAQDTGGAIRGRHLDFFCGFGERAEYIAGKMSDRADIFFMVRKYGKN
ncbi:MltA domain protein [Desulfonatronospira thiodismutans ASO3-1]|uniref:peptidoglycan lytic exotransglycosylase n=1 Tax=Desulfonatronospira thiodismutans ASO3-1 TaxID=555779 RepID=D6SR74_9BACT|nr:murein transglycosylase A [Desulfonatronospira thiodismutans]EFI33190.1 MltA domain protein [Desulfonatronospira thiodismutans ASO3-1]RQD75460.1 MAG: transglycosylase [Desulfonatronospira sp. MSAO_Bac3]